MYKKDVDLLTSFAHWSSSWRMAQLNSCSRVSKLLMCHNLLSGYYTLEEGTLVFGRSLQLLIRDKRQVTLLNGNIKIPNLGFIISNRILNTFLCFHQLQLQLLSTKFCILYCYITDHYAHNVHISYSCPWNLISYITAHCAYVINCKSIKASAW